MNQREVNRRELDLKEDPSLLSPPIVAEPLYHCATVVTVLGFVPQASIDVEVNGGMVASVSTGSPIPDGITITLPAQLNANDQVRARQSTATAQSAWSAPVQVRDHTKDYPAGPPRPQVNPAPVYECGVRTGVSNLLIGGNVWITADGVEVGRVNGCKQHQGVNVAPAYGLNQKVRAWFELCNDPSPPSIEHITIHPPSPLPTPIIAPQYEGGDQLSISNIVNGALVTVNRGGSTGTWPCWGGSITIYGWNPKFSAGEQIEATQTMCPSDPPSPPGVVTVEPCSNLPAPTIGPVQAGDDRITLMQFVPGAVITIFLNNVQVGTGGGPVVFLTTQVSRGDKLHIIQDLAGCRGEKALEVIVACVDSPVTYDPFGLDLFPIGYQDYSKGRVKGNVYYPADDDGNGQPFNSRLASLGRVPIVFMAHGNHDPNVPNYLGYDYFQQALARMGIVAVSVDCNALNGQGYSIQIIEGRTDLIIDSIKHFQSLDSTASSVFFQHLDFARVGLMGHSQGGEAVVLTPEVINVAGVLIRAVLALAPTEGGATSRMPKGYAFMTILPAADGDVWPNDGAIYYDQAEPAPFKSQLYVHLTNHQFYNRQWLDDDSTWFMAAPTAPVMSRYDHERVLAAYGCALFRNILLGHPTTGFLSGHALPAYVQTQNVHLSFESAEVLTVDNHEDNNGIGANSLNQPTSQTAGLSADEFAFHQGGGSFNGSFYGETTGMVIRPGPSGRVFTSPFAGTQDLTNHEIRIRTAEVTDGSQIVGDPTGFELGVQDVNGVTAWIDSDEVGGVPRPFSRKPGTIKTMLKTLRFHSGCFSIERNLDLKAIQAVLIRCNRKDEHALAFDDLQVLPS